MNYRAVWSNMIAISHHMWLLNLNWSKFSPSVDSTEIENPSSKRTLLEILILRILPEEPLLLLNQKQLKIQGFGLPYSVKNRKSLVQILSLPYFTLKKNIYDHLICACYIFENSVPFLPLMMVPCLDMWFFKILSWPFNLASLCGVYLYLWYMTGVPGLMDHSILALPLFRVSLLYGLWK